MTSQRYAALNDRLRQRRQEFGASIERVARWAGIGPERLAEIEGGSAIRSWEFDAICRALAVDSGALARGLDRTPRRSVARFRAARWAQPAAEDLRTLSLAAELGRIGGSLAQGIDRQARLARLRSPQPIDEKSKPWRQGYRLGENARRALEPLPGPIRSLEGLLTEWGVHVGRVEFTSAELDAASLWEGGALPVILLNTKSIRTRSALSRRPLLAHELCHLLHDSGENDLTTEISWGEGTPGYREAVEQRARAFAPAFLAPRDEVTHWFAAGEGRRIRKPESKVKELAERWGFSLRGAIWHAKNCGIIPPAAAGDLDSRTQDQDHPWSAQFETDGREPVGAAPPAAAYESAGIAQGLLSRLVAEAATTSLISEGRAREILTWR